MACEEVRDQVNISTVQVTPEITRKSPEAGREA